MLECIQFVQIFQSVIDRAFFQSFDNHRGTNTNNRNGAKAENCKGSAILSSIIWQKIKARKEPFPSRGRGDGK